MRNLTNFGTSRPLAVRRVNALWVVFGCMLVACGGRASSLGDDPKGGSQGAAEREPEPQPSAGGSGQAAPRSVPSDGAARSAGGANAVPASGGSSASVGGAGNGGNSNDDTSGSGGEMISQADGGGGGDEPTIEFPARGVCGPMVVEYTKMYCPELDSASIQLISIEDRGSDGSISPGEDGFFVFSITNSDSVQILSGPCVGVGAGIPGLTVLESYNPTPSLYGVLPNSSAKVKTHFRVEPSVAPGTRIPLQAWLDIHSALCPNGGDASFELEVAP
ncbi:MAG TPA: hypothetical protein VER96_03350 [Polyangiaceae bacterium]|nr:hypothetical protein [Polyangiaceae bacterium]